MSKSFLNDCWNPWHGCHKYSAGCKNCYVYRRDETVGRDASVISKNSDFNLPLRKNRKGEYKIPSGSEIFVCMTSDFFLEDADIWREDIWNIIRLRSDVTFLIITKRILRFYDCIPSDWGNGYENVVIFCTMENQAECDRRFPFFKNLPIKNKGIICEPILSDIDMSKYLDSSIFSVTVGGESGRNARICNYDWVLNIRNQCINAQVNFSFKQTGANFLKDGTLYRIERRFQHSQARAANINIYKYNLERRFGKNQYKEY